MSCLPPPLPASKGGSVGSTSQLGGLATSEVGGGGSGSLGGEGAAAEGRTTSPPKLSGSQEAQSVGSGSMEASPLVSRRAAGSGSIEAAGEGSEGGLGRPTPASDAAGSSSSADGERTEASDGGGGGGGGGALVVRDRSASEEAELGAVQRLSADLCSSARQAAHANARLGHAMASERENHKAALALSQRRLSYLSADVNARLLFSSQPSKHASAPATVAFAALMLPAMRNGLPTHWLSAESVESLRRWCEEESTAITSLRCVIGRVVHVAGPLTVTAAGGGDNPYHLPAGEQYYVVHAEMMMQHRWVY